MNLKLTICAYDAPGNIDGPTSWLKRLLPYLKERGVQCRLIFIAANSKKLAFRNEMNSQGFESVLIPWELFLEEKIEAILEDLRQHPPDVFVPNYFPAACYAARWAEKAGIPSMIILHNDNPMHHALVDEFATGQSGSDLSAVVAVSKFIRNSIAKKIPPGVILEYITYGAPVPEAQVVRRPGEPLKLIYAGRFTEHQKRISDVALAFCKVAREVPGTQCIMYGTGEALPSVMHILRTEGAGLPVSYGGVLDSSVVIQRFLENHVYVLLSDYEGLPISLMEAMGAGLVPVCTNMRSGINEVIENEKNGFIVNDRDGEFVRVIRRLVENETIWRSCSALARQTIVDDYSQAVCNQKWLDLFSRLAAKNMYKGHLALPRKETLLQIRQPEAIKDFDQRTPAPWKIPFFLIKRKAGRLKRALFK